MPPLPMEELPLEPGGTISMKMLSPAAPMGGVGLSSPGAIPPALLPPLPPGTDEEPQPASTDETIARARTQPPRTCLLMKFLRRRYGGSCSSAVWANYSVARVRFRWEKRLTAYD